MKSLSVAKWGALLLLVSCLAYSQEFKSPFPSSIPGIQIPNVHAVAKNVFRGNEPFGHMDDLDKLGITDVLIFKNESAHEVQDEITHLNGKRYLHISFPWKDIVDFRAVCGQAVQGLKYAREVAASKDRNLFFHCTVGEDRTGLLAGLFRMAHDGWSADRAFKREMCAHGYEAADPGKPDKVVKLIRASLTPLFLAMAEKITYAYRNGESITEDICQKLRVPKYFSKRRFTCKRP